MKARLMHPDQGFDSGRELPPEHAALARDLDLDVLVGAMADGDPLVHEVCAAALLQGAHNDLATTRYRQAAVRDALLRPETVRVLYDLAGDAIDRRKKEWLGIFSRSPAGILVEASALLQMYVGMLRRLRRVVEEAPGEFVSEGWTALARLVAEELDDAFFADAERSLSELREGSTLLASARLGEGNEGREYTLLRGSGRGPRWLTSVLRRGPNTFGISSVDDGASRVLADMRNVTVARVADLLARAAEGVKEFFEALRVELAFYVGCLNLHAHLEELGVPVCFPTAREPGGSALRFSHLVDPTLALRSRGVVVGNTLDLDGKEVTIITGANQGGKTVFVRSLGVAQLLLQSGLFVTANAFEGEVVSGLYTHFRHEEDETLTSGKLDEELGRLSAIVEHLQPRSLVLFNESFAATNEREGSEVARQVVAALEARQVRVVFVTHLFLFAQGLYGRESTRRAFLRAERRPDGTRSFQLVAGEPLETSYGEDLYREILADAVEA